MDANSGKPATNAFSLLRKEAEEILNGNDWSFKDTYSKKDIDELLHEIQVQHIELEMQNEQLRMANVELEIQREKFLGLYDIAPVGYFILDHAGIIKEVNNTGCRMLGVSKSDQHKKNFKDFIVTGEREVFAAFLDAMQIYETRQTCLLTMQGCDGVFFAQVEGIVPATDDPADIRCYVAVIDITERKNAEAIHEKQVLMATIISQENERKRISDALHNSVGQLLYGIKLKMDKLGLTNGSYKELNILLDNTIEETRNISFELAPSILQDFGLCAALDEMAKRLCTADIEIQVNIDLKERLELMTEINIFRIIQELVNNSIKHGGASNIGISLKTENTITIEVTDNGIGFDYEEKENKTSGSGLAAIRNRLGLYGGAMFIESAPGKGSRTQIILHENKMKD